MLSSKREVHQLEHFWHQCLECEHVAQSAQPGWEFGEKCLDMIYKEAQERLCSKLMEHMQITHR